MEEDLGLGVLADTSIWVEWFRLGESGRAAGLGEHLAAEDILTTGPVAAELGQGFRSPDDAEAVMTALASLPWIHLTQPNWFRAGTVMGSLRRAGVAVSIADVLIAMSAVQAGAALWTLDAEFLKIRDVLPDLDLSASAGSLPE